MRISPAPSPRSWPAKSAGSGKACSVVGVFSDFRTEHLENTLDVAVIHIAEPGEGAEFLHIDPPVLDDRIIDMDADHLADDHRIDDLGVRRGQHDGVEMDAFEMRKAFFYARRLDQLRGLLREARIVELID